jgi:RNA polymerase-associated protein CTR9
MQALKAQPNDKAVMYNIAMIQQKAVQMLFAVAPAKRSLHNLEKAIEEAKDAQKYGIKIPLCVPLC